MSEDGYVVGLSIVDATGQYHPDEPFSPHYAGIPAQVGKIIPERPGAWASCPKTQTNSRLARRAVSVVIDPWRAPDLGRVGGDVGDSGSPYTQGKHGPATGCHAPGRRPGSRPGPHLDQNVLAGYAAAALALILDPSGGLFSDATRPGQRPFPYLAQTWHSKIGIRAVHPRKRRYFRWKDFSELYLAVLRIDKQCPDTGVIDRFLADIVSNKGKLKLNVTRRNLQKAMSMLLMLGNRRVKAFPKVLAIIESILQSSAGAVHEKDILTYVDSYLRTLVKDEDRNQYLISWIAYFLVSNGLKGRLTDWPKFADPITRSVFANRGRIFKSSTDFNLFEGSRSIGRRMSMLEHLDIFNPPRST